MGFVERELQKINTALVATPAGALYDRLYVAQQALAWAIEPGGAKSPYNFLMGSYGVPEGCSDESRLPQSLGTCARCAPQ